MNAVSLRCPGLRKIIVADFSKERVNGWHSHFVAILRRSPGNVEVGLSARALKVGVHDEIWMLLASLSGIRTLKIIVATERPFAGIVGKTVNFVHTIHGGLFR